MISKLCGFVLRTEFVLRVLRDLFLENEDQQVMILAHNRNVLTYMHDAVAARGIAGGSVGYYVGGMKEADLKKTETKKVVIATYSMAQEALDIKSLTTLIMATPKTDIEQAVGRILRQKHGNPIVVDIVDTHAPFQNQWQKRQKFYKKQNYKILFTTDKEYLASLDPWTHIEDVCSKNKRKTDVVVEEVVDLLQGKCLLPLFKK
jgi:superfamily II DNA or RNA helicase